MPRMQFSGQPLCVPVLCCADFVKQKVLSLQNRMVSRGVEGHDPVGSEK